MVNLKFPITEVEDYLFKINVDLRIYSQEAITANCYKFSGEYYVHQQKDENNDNIIIVFIESKDKTAIIPDVVKQFCTDLIDQQIRIYTNKQFGHIRDLIVEEAFKPINKLQ